MRSAAPSHMRSGEPRDTQSWPATGTQAPLPASPMRRRNLPVKSEDVARLVREFPAIFAPQDDEDRTLSGPLTGYFHAGGPGKASDYPCHGHYIEDRKTSIPVIHEHKGGHLAHSHEEE
jgi:hypothetical protein